MLKRIQKLIEQLNIYRDAYYNHDESLISDKQYDDLFDELQSLEQISGIVFANSPTQSVGYEVQDKLNKVKHDHPMLSLSKTKEVLDVVKFANSKPIIAMLKMDGLTCSLHYNEDGYLVKAETRGNGEIGEDILANAKQIKNIPIHINNHGIPFTIDGEVIVDYDTFNKININGEYSHPRNLASGSIRQLNTEVTASRNLKFIAWRVIEGITLKSFSISLESAKYLGFEVVPYYNIKYSREDDVNDAITYLKKCAERNKFPIDGIVFSYEDIVYGNSRGETAHHPLHSLAYKWYNEEYETILRDIEWNPTRTGILAPVAIFDPVDLSGAITTKASLHNVSIIKELELGSGDTITVSRRNEVIPHIEENLTRSNTYVIPAVCPVCGGKAKIKKDGIAEVLYCTNDNCSAKNIAKFAHYVSREGMNIDGLSDATIEKFIAMGFIKNYVDIYHLEEHKEEICNLDGFGKKSYDKLISAIDKSRQVNLQNFLVAIGIPQIGKSGAKDIANYKDIHGSWFRLVEHLNKKFDFTMLPDFGVTTNSAIYNFFTNEKLKELDELVNELQFIKREETTINEFIVNKTFVITGAFSKPRKEYEELIINAGGKLAGSVSKKTDYLLTNDKESGSSKNLKAKELGIPILSEEEFLAKLQR